MNDEPFVLYKFRPINKYLIESLVTRSLYFAKPDTLNDPFDCKIDLKRVLKRAEQSATDEQKSFLTPFLENPQFFGNWKSYFDSIGVCSFSLVNADTLLWSHYADEHRGVCLEYHFRGSYFLQPEFQLTAAGNVEYHPEPLTEWLKNAPMEMTPFAEGLVHKYLKTKNPAWSYEKEARIIRGKHGTFNIKENFLKRVYFGLQTPQTDIDLVTKLAQDYNGCLSFGQLVRDETEFGFTVKTL
ncbi:MAG: DUF2971 domain-containing protein [Gallionella sp.]